MQVRVRFATSPNAQPHISNLRTALVNWLFARHHNGSFVLRIADLARRAGIRQGAKAVREALQWLGLEWDEGPDVGGTYGPYVQSERLGRYHHQVRQLLVEDKAYRCYCSPQRLRTVRQEQIARGEPPVYDGRCRSLPRAQIATFETSGIVPRARFRTAYEGEITLQDLILGQVRANASLDDTVLLRRDGGPTRHLADVVDDHDMAITHVIQEQAWLPSTPSHLSLYDAFGWRAPQYAHLPAIGGPEDARLERFSSLDTFHEQGYLAPALVNELARLGWSPRGKQKLLSLRALAERFELDRVSRKASRLDRDRLNWFNHRCLRRMGAADLARLLSPRWQERCGISHRASGTGLEPEAWQRALALAIREDLQFLAQAPDKVRFAFTDEWAGTPAAERVLAQAYAPSVLELFAQELSSVAPFEYDPIDAFVSELRWKLKGSLGIRSRDVMYVIRAALTGDMHGPCLVVVCQLLGRDRCIQRARAALSQFAPQARA